jgi:hypothetical protein
MFCSHILHTIEVFCCSHKKTYAIFSLLRSRWYSLNSHGSFSDANR